MITKKKNIIIWPCAMCEDEDILWIYHGQLNMLFSYNLNKRVVELECILENEYIREASMVKVVKVDNKVYMIPFWGNHIHVYDIIKKEQKIIHMKLENEYEGKRIFCKAFEKNGVITCVPANYHSIIRIDTKKDELTYVIKLNKELEKYGIYNIDINDADIDENGIIYGVISSSNKYVKIDIDNKNVNVNSVIGDVKLSNIRTLKGDIYVSIYEDKNTSKGVLRIRDNRIIAEYNEPFILRTATNYLLIDSINGYWIQEVNANGNVVNKIEETCLEEFPFQYSYKFGLIVKGSCDEYYFSRRDYHLRVVSPNGPIDEHDILTYEIDNKLLWPYKEVLYESEIVDIGTFIDMI